MEQTIDNRIKITHFVNPHLFYFKWVREDGYNDDLDKLEKKVETTAKQRIAESLKDKDGTATERKIRMSEMVAVFVPDWHKYIRASVKRKEAENLYCVWAIDYGVPMMANISNIVKLPSAFTGMQLNKKNSKRIHTGGMENCLPAEKQFNMDKESSDKQKLMDWSPQAINLVQKILDQAIKLEFEHVQDLSPQKRPHYFGRLMMQRPSDGQMINVMKSLLEMNMAVLAEQEFKNELTSIESLSQPIIFSVNNELLDVKMCVVAVKTVSYDTGYTNSDIFEDESENESVIGENGGELTIEDNEFFNDSASMMQPRLRDETVVNDTLVPIPEKENPFEDHSNSNASQAKLKSNRSKGKSDDGAQNNNNNENQLPKNGNKNRDRKQRNKGNSNVSNRNNQSPNPQQQLPKQQQHQQPQMQQPSQQQQKQNHHHQQQPQQSQAPHQQHQYHYRKSMSFDQSGAQQRPMNGEQIQNHSNLQHLPHHPKQPFTPHPAAQSHFRTQIMRNSRDARFAGCTEFEALLGKPPPTARFHPLPPFNPLLRQPPALHGSIPPHPINFNGMYGPPQPGHGSTHHPHPSRQSNMRNSFDDTPTKQAMNLMSMLNIQSQNHPNNSSNNNNNANQRGQNRMRNRTSGFQGRSNQSAVNAGKVNGNEHRNTDGMKSILKSPVTLKVNSEKSEKSQETSEKVE